MTVYLLMAIVAVLGTLTNYGVWAAFREPSRAPQIVHSVPDTLTFHDWRGLV